MDLYFIDHEASDCCYFEDALKQHELHFLKSIADVPADAEIVSMFIDSKIDAAFLAAHPALKLVATRSTTFDHIDLEACAARRITVSYVPSYGKYTVAEHTFALLLALARRLRQAMDVHRKPNFSYETLRGFRLGGKTLGVVGGGRIGVRVLHLAGAFGMRCIAYDIHHRPGLAARLKFQYVEFHELLARSDIISLHVPLTPETFHILNREAFDRCKPGVMIINTARGALIDTKALLEAMDKGIVGGVGLDVLEDERVFRYEMSKIVSNQIIDHLHSAFREKEARTMDPERIKELTTLVHNEDLLSRPNVVFTPHIAFNSIEAVECINRATVNSIEGFLRGKPINIVRPKPKASRGVPSQGAGAREGSDTPYMSHPL